MGTDHLLGIMCCLGKINASKSLQMVIVAMKLKDAYCLEGKLHSYASRHFFFAGELCKCKGREISERDKKSFLKASLTVGKSADFVTAL